MDTDEANDQLRIKALVMGSEFWVHRRVDAIRLDGEGNTRRTVSLDMTIPKGLAIRGSQSRVIIPLAILEKDVLRSLDTCDAGGKTLSVLRSSENSHYAYLLSTALAPDWLRENGELKEPGKSLLWSLIKSPPGNLDSALEDFGHWIEEELLLNAPLRREEETKLSIFKQYAERLEHSFILLVEVDDKYIGQRAVFKYSHNTEISGKVRASRVSTFAEEVPDFGFAASQHVEIETPPGLLVNKLTIIDIGPSGQPVDASQDSPRNQYPRRDGHVAISPGSRLNTGYFVVEIKPSAQGIYSFTMVSLAMVTLAVAIGLSVKWDLLNIVRRDTITPLIPSPSASILLIGPALLLSWFARTPEHTLTATLLRPLRLMLFFCAVALLLMATAAAIPLVPTAWNALWGLVAAANIFAIIGFFDFHLRLLRRLSSRNEDES